MWRLIVVAGVIVFYRYSLNLSTPRSDWWHVEEYALNALRWLRIEVNMLRVWLIGLVRYVPTDTVLTRWQRLADAVRSGRYGEAGT